MKTCFLYPGQGAQYPGMGKDFFEESGEVKRLFETASEVAEKDIEKLLFEGTEDELKATDNTQIAVTVVNCAASIVLGERGILADGAAGFSLGEYSALWEAGVLSTEDLFAVVKTRGAVMERESRKVDTAGGPAGMAAVIGLAYDEAMEVLEGLKEDRVYLANYSSPIQLVLAGTAEGLDKAESAFDAAGAMKYVRLKVSGPFHSPLLKSARDEFEEFLTDITFNDPKKPVYANVTGRIVTDGLEAKALCAEQIVSPVRWVDEEQSLLQDGYERYLETGPGSVLSGLWKSFYKKIRCRKAGTVADIEEILAE
ncbi:MAG: ACP S-malonyltransferase [Spirochaetia bacterium]